MEIKADNANIKRGGWSEREGDTYSMRVENTTIAFHTYSDS
jgi:hypothetical protein